MFQKILDMCNYTGCDKSYAQWIKKELEEYALQESFDASILVPLGILHRKGKEAEEILKKVGYEKDKIKQIMYCITDYGDENVNTAIFEDFNFMWKLTEEGYKCYCEKNGKEMKRVLKNEMEKRIYFSKGLKKRCEQYLEDLNL